MAFSLAPLPLVPLYAVVIWAIGVLQRLDNIIDDARLRATLPHKPEPCVVIVDIDEQSLAEVGRWPWPRDRAAQLIDRLFVEQHIAPLVFDTVFDEPDPSPAQLCLTATSPAIRATATAACCPRRWRRLRPCRVALRWLSDGTALVPTSAPLTAADRR
jgi:CHASE2 domain-containing sensor protein